MRFQNGSNKLAIEVRVVIEVRVMQSEIILMILNQTHAACSIDFEIMSMISDQIAFHTIGHFQITFSLFFKASLGAHPFI